MRCRSSFRRWPFTSPTVRSLQHPIFSVLLLTMLERAEREEIGGGEIVERVEAGAVLVFYIGRSRLRASPHLSKTHIRAPMLEYFRENSRAANRFRLFLFPFLWLKSERSFAPDATHLRYTHVWPLFGHERLEVGGVRRQDEYYTLYPLVRVRRVYGGELEVDVWPLLLFVRLQAQQRSISMLWLISYFRSSTALNVRY
jgi:hypothetical protein